MTEHAALEAAGLGKRYGSKWALRDCSLEIPSGSVTALVGPNGAGEPVARSGAGVEGVPGDLHVVLLGSTKA